MTNLNIPFMSYRKIATIVSLSLLVLSILSLGLRGLNLGLDFSGGTLIEVSYSEAADLNEIRDLMSSNGFDDFQVVNFGSNTDVLIKVADK
ncbi:protein translocase subunit SecF, partial [Gammaproteobacteria bacterium]|nr:protein translocase subunit SecF [Gammaproteobacteria bacterium]